MGKARIIIQILMLANNRALRWSLASSVLSPFIRFWDNLTALQAAAVISALVLTIGAIVEYWYKLKLLAFLLFKWILRKSTPFDRCVFKRLLLHSIGPILVVLGIAGEVVFEGRTFVVEDRQEEQARQIVGSLGDKAKTAIDDSSTALSIANDAKQVSHEARQEADSFEKDIVSAKRQAADAESHLANALQQAVEAKRALAEYRAPRLLSLEQQKRIASRISRLGLEKGQDVMVAAAPITVETGTLAEQILAAVKLAVPNASWFGGGTEIGPLTRSAAVSGVVVFATRDTRSIKLAGALVEALTAEGINASLQNSLLGCEKLPQTNPNDPYCFHVFIVVGPKL